MCTPDLVSYSPDQSGGSSTRYTWAQEWDPQCGSRTYVSDQSVERERHEAEQDLRRHAKRDGDCNLPFGVALLHAVAPAELPLQGRKGKDKVIRKGEGGTVERKMGEKFPCPCC